MAQALLNPIESIPTIKANIDSINQQLAEITGAGAWDPDGVYNTGTFVTYDDGNGASLYRAKQDTIPAGTLPTNTAYWDYVGDFASIGEAVAALTASVTDIKNSVDILDGKLTSNVRRTDTMISAYRDDDDGEGRLADVLAGWKAKAAIKLEQKTRASADEAFASQIETITASVGDNIAAVQQVSQAQANLDGTVSALTTIKAQTTSNGKKVMAGLVLGSDGETSEVGVIAQRFFVANENDLGSLIIPFVIENGLTVIASALIGILLNKQIIQRVGSSMLVISPGFGSSNQFIFWFGPDVGDISNCTEATATIYLKTDGSGYFGGSLFAGTIYSSGRFNTYGVSIGQDTAAQLDHNNSIGHVKTIVVGCDTSLSETKTFSSLTDAQAWLDQFSPDGTGTLTWGVYRNGTLIQTLSKSATTRKIGPDQTGTGIWNVSAEHIFRTTTITISDTYSGTGTVHYEVKLISTSGSFWNNSPGFYYGLISIQISEQ